jgi:hypothetical protein
VIVDDENGERVWDLNAFRPNPLSIPEFETLSDDSAFVLYETIEVSTPSDASTISVRHPRYIFVEKNERWLVNVR